MTVTLYVINSTHQENQANLDDKRPKGRSKTRWKDDEENDIRKKGIVNWRQVAQDGDEWSRATEDALILFRFLGHRRRIRRIRRGRHEL